MYLLLLILNFNFCLFFPTTGNSWCGGLVLFGCGAECFSNSVYFHTALYMATRQYMQAYSDTSVLTYCKAEKAARLVSNNCDAAQLQKYLNPEDMCDCQHTNCNGN